MSDTKFGIAQLSKPAPEAYRNFSNAMIIFILPATTILVSSWGFADKLLNHILTILLFIPALIKGVGTLLGNGQYYTSDAKASDIPPPAAELKQNSKP